MSKEIKRVKSMMNKELEDFEALVLARLQERKNARNLKLLNLKRRGIEYGCNII